MSFQDFGPRRHREVTASRQNNYPALKVRVVPLSPELTTRKKQRPVVLHGRVLKKQQGDDAPDVSSSSASSEEVSEHHSTTKRKSTFAKLTHETQHFQKLVADLELVLSRAGESPEAAWRARILIRSAQDADKALCDRLLDYEKTLLLQRCHQQTQTDLRTAQTACVKLHRDFKRCRQALVTCLTLYERRQQVEVSQLGAVGYNNTTTTNTQEDFFDRAMRQKELERMNTSMHKVNDIYKELANLVESQQDDIDRVEEVVEFAAENVESAAEEIHCYGRRGQLINMCGAMDLDDAVGCAQRQPGTFDATVSYSDEHFQSSSSPRKGMRVGEQFHWMMPFETLKADMTSVQQDIIGVGKGLVMQGQDIGKRLECGGVESTID